MKKIYSAICMLLLSLPHSIYAKTYADTTSLIRIVNGRSSATQKAIAMQELASYYNEQGNPYKAMDWAAEAVSYAMKSKNDSLLFSLSLQYSDLCASQGNTDDAIEAMNQYIVNRPAEGHKKNLGIAYNNIGVLNEDVDRFTEAISNYLKAEKIYEEAGLINDFMEVENNIAGVYFNMGNPEKSLESYYKITAYYKGKANIKQLAACYNGLFMCYLKLKNADSARFYSDALTSAANKLRTPALQFKSWNAQSILYTSLLQDRKKSAIANDSMMYYAEILDDKATLQKVYSQMGMYYCTIVKDLEKGRKYFEKALEVSQQTNEKRAIISNLNNLATAYDLLGNHAKAFRLMEQAYQLKDSVLTEAGIEKVAEMNARFQAEKKEAKIKLLTNKARLQQRTGLFMIACMVLLSIIGLLLYRGSREKQKANIKLKQINSALAEANAAKAKLLSIMGHDLRSPINQVYQYLKLQQMKSVITEEENAQLSEKIQNAAGSLLETMEDLLLWSKSQLSAIVIQKTNTTVLQEIDRCIALLKLNIDAKKLTINNSIPASVTKNTDPYILQIIVRNLLQNAIKAAGINSIININYNQNTSAIEIINNGGTFTQQDYKTTISNNEGGKTLEGFGLKLVDELSQKVDITVRFYNPDPDTTNASIIII